MSVAFRELPNHLGMKQSYGFRWFHVKVMEGVETLRYMPYLKIWMQPCPLVRKNKLLCLFHEISFTSKLNCSSALILCVRVSMKVTRSSLFPTAIVLPSGDHVILIFSPGENKENTTEMTPDIIIPGFLWWCWTFRFLNSWEYLEQLLIKGMFKHFDIWIFKFKGKFPVSTYLCKD